MITQNSKLLSNILQLNQILNVVPSLEHYIAQTCLCESPKRRHRRRKGLSLHFAAILIYCMQSVVTFRTKQANLHLSPVEEFLYRIGILMNIASHIYNITNI